MLDIINHYDELSNRSVLQTIRWGALSKAGVILAETRLDIKTYPLLRRMIKTLTAKRVKKKANIFTSKQIKKILTEYDNDDPAQLEEKLQLHYFTTVY